MVEYFHGMECFLPGMREEDAVIISRVGGGGKKRFLWGGGQNFCPFGKDCSTLGNN